MKSAQAWHGPWRPGFCWGRWVQVLELPQKKTPMAMMSCNKNNNNDNNNNDNNNNDNNNDNNINI